MNSNFDCFNETLHPICPSMAKSREKKLKTFFIKNQKEFVTTEKPDLPKVLKWKYYECFGTNIVDCFVGELIKLQSKLIFWS